MAASRTVIIAGAGIGGLVAALTLVQHGLRVILLEQAQRLEEVGAGIQLSPNASRILMSLGLEPLLRPFIVTPTELMVMHARTARVLARARLGATDRLIGSSIAATCSRCLSISSPALRIFPCVSVPESRILPRTAMGSPSRQLPRWVPLRSGAWH